MDGVTTDHGIDAAKIQTKSLYLTDGIRPIDFVLAWQKSDNASEEDLRSIKRHIFEQNLIGEGLVLEYDIFDSIHCTKIHAPIEVLRRYSEILKLRLPMKSVGEHKRCSGPVVVDAVCFNIDVNVVNC